jgi:hypothetical protein
MTALQTKISESLKRHPEKAGVTIGKGRSYNSKGVWARYKIVAKECGCSVGAVQTVSEAEQAAEIGKQQRDQRLVPLAFDQPQTTDMGLLIKDFPGWVPIFGKLSLMINCYLQIARVMGNDMPAAWLESMRDQCENAQRRSSQDRDLRKLWPNGPPSGSGNFPECKAIAHDGE